MSAIQLAFGLRTSTNVKSVHLLGSWDNYSGQLPMAKDSAKAGSWKGTFRFQGSTLQAGQRYWYYYIMDGYHVSHDPAQPSTREPTTGRSLNILDVPRSAAGSAAMTTAVPKRGGNRASMEIPKGRALSPSKIVHPKPSKPYASRTIREADYTSPPDVEYLTSHLEKASLYGSSAYSGSPASSIGSDVSSRRSSGGSSPSSLSSLSDRSGSSCRCQRFAVTRGGDRVKVDCGGSRCGSASEDSSSACSSDSEDSEPRSRPVHKVQYKDVAPRPRQATTTTKAAPRRR